MGTKKLGSSKMPLNLAARGIDSAYSTGFVYEGNRHFPLPTV